MGDNRQQRIAACRLAARVDVGAPSVTMFLSSSYNGFVLK